MQPDRIAQLAQWGLSFDTETHRVQPGLLAPPLVCGSFGQATRRPDNTLALHGGLVDRNNTERGFEAALADERITLIGANIAYDMLVMATAAARRGVDLMPAIFRAYALGRVFDVQIAEALHAVAMGHLGKDPSTGKEISYVDPVTGKQRKGGYSLDKCTEFVLGRTNAKANDRWRQSYALLEDVPIEMWPEDARTYPIDDAVNTLEVALAQCGHMPNTGPHGACYQPTPGADLVCPRCGADPLKVPACRTMIPRRNLHDHSVQVFVAWALHLGAAWGVRTDPASVAALEAAAMAGRTANLPGLVERGYLRPDGSEDGAVVRRAVALAYGVDPFSQCPHCNGVGKVYNKFSKRDPSKPVGKPIGCIHCSSTGLELAGSSVPMSDPSGKFPTGQVKTGRDVLVESGDDDLLVYAASQEDDKVLDTYVPFLRDGMFGPINLRPSIILETGRVSYQGVVQLLPRQVSARLGAELKKRRKSAADVGLPAPLVVGVRDCIIARNGWVIYSNDYTGGELVTHAESCVKLVGFSEMGKALNAGVDVHSALGADLMGASYEQFKILAKSENAKEKKRAKDFRQAAKPANFGFPGGMGAVRMVMQQREQGPDTEWPDGPHDLGNEKRGYKGLRFCLLVGGASRCGEVKVTEWNRKPCAPVCRKCVEIAEHIRKAWFKRWPENTPYFDKVSDILDVNGEVVQHYSARVRGGLEFCAAANGYFQALLADIAKRAQIRVTFEQYVRSVVHTEGGLGFKVSVFEGQPSPLFGNSRSVVFAHDELWGECIEVVAPEVSERINEIMVEEFIRACPQHAPACKAEPTIMRRWYKAAEPVLPDPKRPRNLTDNRLQVWEPKP